MSSVGAMTSMAAKALECLTLQALQLHKSTAKLTYISSSIFAALLKDGFCTEEEADKDADGDGGGKFQEAEGTVSLFNLKTFPVNCKNWQKSLVNALVPWMWHVGCCYSMYSTVCKTDLSNTDPLKPKA